MSDLPDLTMLRLHGDSRSEPGAFADPEYVLTWARGGHCDYRIDNRSYHIAPGHAILLRPHQPHVVLPAGPINHQVVHFSLGSGGRWIADCPEVVRCTGQVRRQVDRWFADIQREHEAQQPGFRHICASLSVAILRSLSRLNPVTAQHIQSDTSWPVIERALAIMHRDFATGIGVADIAREAGVSPEHLSRIFMRHSGRGPGRFLGDIRLEQARRLLHLGQLDCAAIASACGYASAQAFSRAFRARIGVPPGRWRRGLRDSINQQCAALNKD
ncbi:MAG: AraC family transcriptional regulator [Planctomycetota bacterium]|jgi:AraC-like DNA-binding protein|nr:AraC family transcriptional regulator [Planctomycetota bacterium]